MDEILNDTGRENYLNDANFYADCNASFFDVNCAAHQIDMHAESAIFPLSLFF